MKLIRGWEKQYTPDITGGLRLNKASRYRVIGEEDGVRDIREGEVRIRSEGEVSVTWKPNEVISLRMSEEIDERGGEEAQEHLRAMLATEYDDPGIQLEPLGTRRWKMLQNVKLNDTALDSPFLFCLSRAPATRSDWDRLLVALPKRYDTWTVTEEVEKLKFEIECGIKRWMGLNEITQHELRTRKGWVAYSYNSAPPSGDVGNVGEVVLFDRWFRKRTIYKNQNEYRLAWDLRSPQMENIPNTIDIELTKTGLNLFKPWNSPEL